MRNILICLICALLFGMAAPSMEAYAFVPGASYEDTEFKFDYEYLYTEDGVDYYEATIYVSNPNGVDVHFVNFYACTCPEHSGSLQELGNCDHLTPLSCQLEDVVYDNDDVIAHTGLTVTYTVMCRSSVPVYRLIYAFYFFGTPDDPNANSDDYYLAGDKVLSPVLTPTPTSIPEVTPAPSPVPEPVDGVNIEADYTQVGAGSYKVNVHVTYPSGYEDFYIRSFYACTEPVHTGTVDDLDMCDKTADHRLLEQEEDTNCPEGYSGFYATYLVNYSSAKVYSLIFSYWLMGSADGVYASTDTYYYLIDNSEPVVTPSPTPTVKPTITPKPTPGSPDDDLPDYPRVTPTPLPDNMITGNIGENGGPDVNITINVYKDGDNFTVKAEGLTGDPYDGKLLLEILSDDKYNRVLDQVEIKDGEGSADFTADKYSPYKEFVAKVIYVYVDKDGNEQQIVQSSEKVEVTFPEYKPDPVKPAGFKDLLWYIWNGFFEIEIPVGEYKITFKGLFLFMLLASVFIYFLKKSMGN